MASLVTGRSLSPSKRDRGSKPGPSVELSGDADSIANHDAGSGRPVTREAMSHATTTPTAPILLRRRSARQKPVRPRPRRHGHAPSSNSDLPAAPDAFLDAVKPFRDGLVVGCECMFAWYWLADLCERRAHPLRPRPRPGHEGHPRRQGQERQDRRRQARRPAPRRLVPDGLRLPAGQARRPATCCGAARFFVRQRAQLIAHIQNTNSPVQPAAVHQEAHLRRQPQRRHRRTLRATRARG